LAESGHIFVNYSRGVSLSTINLSTALHVCEDTDSNFNIRDILAQAGYTLPGPFNINGLVVRLPNDEEVYGDTPLFGQLDADHLYVRPGAWAANWNGSFYTVELVLDLGGEQFVSLELQVIVDPVNDAPSGTDKSFDLLNGNGVVLGEGDFGFHDDVEHDGFKSVLITSLPPSGSLQLNGVAVTVGAEIDIADIHAGHLVFVPAPNVAGNFELGFKVRDDGGTVGCDAHDLSATPNYLTFHVPPVQMAHIGDFVWHDTNANGVQDAGEAGIAGVVVQLKDASGQVVASTTTDAAGAYHFDVNPGTYSVALVTPSGYTVSAQNQGGNSELDNDFDASGKTGLITLAPGATNNSLDAGLYKTAQLGDRVWLDANKNGVQDAGEGGLAGVKVTLLDATGHAVGSPLTTDANGNYLFTNLKPGTYSVQFDKTTLPAGYAFAGKDLGGNDATDSDANQADGSTAQVTLSSGETNNSLDAGVVATPATIGDRVWHDTNANGVQDAGELGLGGVTVQLKNSAGAVVGSTVTDASGNYSFSVDPGTYSVAVVAPSGYLAAAKNAGGNGALDSDIDATGNSSSVTVGAGQVYRDLDAGLYKTAQLGDRVWLDTNKNGVQDAGEGGLAGVKVTLLDASGQAVGSPLTTDANGNYLFTNLKPGTYSVQFDKTTLPAGYVFTGKDQGGNDATDSDANPLDGKTAQTVLESGESDRSWDAGVQALDAHIGDRVWFDSNGNGLQDAGEAGIAGVTVQLKNSAGAVVSSTITDSSGNYHFDVAAGRYSVAVKAPSGYFVTSKDVGSNDANDSDIDASGNTALVTLAAGQTNNTLDAGLYQKASIGNFVWEDKNYNGVQDAGETGIGGVTVNLLGTNNQVLASTTTDSSGKYSFNNLNAGDYRVEVVKPAYYYATRQNLGNDAQDSDIDSSGRTALIHLNYGQNDTSVDAGLYRTACIGDKVWRDRDHDGVQDSNEEGIGGVKVELYNASNQLLATTYTRTDGSYRFAYLNPGEYYLKFDKSNVIFSGINLNDWKWGVKNVGNNDQIDSDVNGDGISKVNVTRTDVTFLESGEYDYSWDAAITPLVIDLGGDGVKTIARADFHGSFDLLGNGHAIQSGWVSADDGFLAIDSNHNGKIDNISELFGGNSKGLGFGKLSSFDSNGDGLVDAHDERFAELRIWRDANSNGVTDAGELLSLHDAGVTSLTVHYTELPFLDANDNLHLERSNATLASGKSVDLTDVYFNVSAKDAAQAGITLPSLADLLRDDHALDALVGRAAAPIGGAAATGAAIGAATGVATEAASAATACPAAHAQCDAAEVLRRVLPHAEAAHAGA
jgi:protocatechuate 3,4-dioxygenase beta subunit